MWALYQIYNLKTDKTYLNISNDPESVCASERFKLDLGMHPCTSLQDDYTTTGLEVFVIEVLETFEDKDVAKEKLEEVKAEKLSQGLDFYI